MRSRFLQSMTPPAEQRTSRHTLMLQVFFLVSLAAAAWRLSWVSSLETRQDQFLGLHGYTQDLGGYPPNVGPAGEAAALFWLTSYVRCVMTIAGTRESLEAGGLTFDHSSVGVGGEVRVNRTFAGVISQKAPRFVREKEDHAQPTASLWRGRAPLTSHSRCLDQKKTSGAGFRVRQSR